MFFILRAREDTEACGSGRRCDRDIVLRNHLPGVHEFCKYIGVMLCYFDRERFYRDVHTDSFQSRPTLGSAQRSIGQPYTS
jgi:hypothetical protein